jgi:predicted transcriptional regulator YheO
LENNVTGRKVGAGATNLMVDLKRRKQVNEDKINYELNIGARKFKCTTIPVYQKPYGLIGAICINIDANYITDEVMKSKENVERFFHNFCKTDMALDENILSKDEYEKALKGKRHWRQAV